MSNKAPRNTVVLKRPKSVISLLALSKAISAAMAANATTFTLPDPPLAQLNAHIADFDAAETAAHSRTTGLAAIRNDKEALVIADLELERAYVQKLVNADPAHAATIAQAAGMALRKPAARTKAPLAAKPGTLSGAVTLAARATRYSSNDWQYSLDCKIWTSVTSSMQAKTVVSGLSPGVLHYFRHRAVTKTGASDWSQAVSLIVV